MTKLILYFFFTLGILNFGSAQDSFVIQNKDGFDRIKFRLINNLIILPVEINGVTLSFILDTGVSKPILFNFLNVSDSLKIKNPKTIHLRGLGGDKSVEALKSENNVFKIGDAIKLNQELYAVYNTNLDLGPKLGIPVHGIIGYDLFKDFIVEIKYSTQTIIIAQPEKYEYKTCSTCTRLVLSIYDDKPYTYAKARIQGKEVLVRLLIDSGSSDALWLFENDSLGIKCDKQLYFRDFLGHGLTGSVYGKRSRLEAFSLKNIEMKNVNAAFPDAKSIFYAQKIKNRNGSLSGGILKRFNVIFDYKNRTITLKKNRFFKDDFSYNKSGIELAHTGTRLVKEIQSGSRRNSFFPENNETNSNVVIKRQVSYKYALKPAYEIIELREGSPAQLAGLKQGDIVLGINSKPAQDYSLQQIIHMFYQETGKKIRLKVRRGEKILNYNFLLQPLLEK